MNIAAGTRKFVCHCSKSKAVIRAIIRQSDTLSRSALMDEDHVGLGENLKQAILEAIGKESAYLFLFLDEHGFTDWIIRELTAAKAMERKLKRPFVLPIFLAAKEEIVCRDEQEERLLEYLGRKCFERLNNQTVGEIKRIAREIDRKFQILLEKQSRPQPTALVLKPARKARKKGPDAPRTRDSKNMVLVNRLAELMLSKSDRVRRIFAKSDSFKIAKQVTIELQRCPKDQKESVRGFLAKLYAESRVSDSMEMLSIRQNCCFYIGRLGTASAKLFLKSALTTEKSPLVKRGIYMGLILSERDGRYLEAYLDLLTGDPIEASINAGYHQCHYGDKFHAEGFFFDESESTEATMRAIFYHLSKKEYRSIWPIDYFTLRFIVYQCSSRNLNLGQRKILTANLPRADRHPEGFRIMQQRLFDLLEATELVEEEPGKKTEFFFEPTQYCKKLPHRPEILLIKEEYEKTVYIDGNFLPWEPDAHETYRANIDRDRAKAESLVKRSLELAGLDKSRKLRLLDIGCGYGAFIHAWKNAGLGPAEGIEIAESAEKLEKQIYDENLVHRFDAREIDDYEGIGKADVVSAMDFFEHLFNAELFLRRLWRGMRADAVFLLYSPIVSIEDLDAKRLPKTRYFYPQHIYYFTLNGLIEFVERHGFQRVSNNKIGDFKELILFRKA